MLMMTFLDQWTKDVQKPHDIFAMWMLILPAFIFPSRQLLWKPCDSLVIILWYREKIQSDFFLCSDLPFSIKNNMQNVCYSLCRRNFTRALPLSRGSHQWGGVTVTRAQIK